jgi:hypothetical protein
MSEEKNQEIVASQLDVKATASLEEEINKEIEVEDPSIEQAKAILNEK